MNKMKGSTKNPYKHIIRKAINGATLVYISYKRKPGKHYVA